MKSAKPEHQGILTPEFHMHAVSNEAEMRDHLLDMVTVDERGVATCANHIAGTILRLAAVHVDNTDTARHIPLQQHMNRARVVFPWPSKSPGKLGFFVDYTSHQAISVAFRSGEYPGTPLTTSRQPIGPATEWLMALDGITKPAEQPERNWAHEIDLYGALVFNPGHTRGLFRQAIHRHQGSNVWKRRRLAYSPPNTRHRSISPRSAYAYADTFQILGYKTTADHLGALSVVSLQAAFEVRVVPNQTS